MVRSFWCYLARFIGLWGIVALTHTARQSPVCALRSDLPDDTVAGFYKRGCQEKTLLPLLEGGIVL